MSVSGFYGLDSAGQAIRMKELARVALEKWGLEEGELELIKYRENAVFKVELNDGTRYALRIHRFGYHSDQELRSELQWMSALDDSGIDVPQAVRLPDGDYFTVVEFAGVPEPRQVDLFEWIDGEPPASRREIADECEVGAGGQGCQVVATKPSFEHAADRRAEPLVAASVEIVNVEHNPIDAR